jgi:hypothetical protein
VTFTLPEYSKGWDKDNNTLTKIDIYPFNGQLTPPQGFDILGLPYVFEPAGAVFDPPLTITFYYGRFSLDPQYLINNLIIAYYNPETGRWIEQKSTIDTETKTISVNINHFSIFALLGKKLNVSEAKFSLSDLYLSSNRVSTGERIDVRLNVVNLGYLKGSYEAVLKINDVVEATQQVNLDVGQQKEISFSIHRDTPGLYKVAVGDLISSFTVVSPAVCKISNISINPQEVQAGQTVKIILTVSNTGDEPGSYKAILKINGTLEQDTDITLNANSNQEVTFSVIKTVTGKYEVDVNGLKGSFTVYNSSKLFWVIFLIALLVITGAICFIVWRRKNRLNKGI